MAETVAYKYRTVISYGHADTSGAKRLHRALEGFSIDKSLGSLPKSCSTRGGQRKG